MQLFDCVLCLFSVVFISSLDTCAFGSNNPSLAESCNAGIASTEGNLVSNAAASCYTVSDDSGGAMSSAELGEIIGGTVGGAAFLVCVAGVIYWQFFLVNPDSLLGVSGPSKATDAQNQIW